MEERQRKREILLQTGGIEHILQCGDGILSP